MLLIDAKFLSNFHKFSIFKNFQFSKIFNYQKFLEDFFFILKICKEKRSSYLKTPLPRLFTSINFNYNIANEYEIFTTKFSFYFENSRSLFPRHISIIHPRREEKKCRDKSVSIRQFSSFSLSTLSIR